MKRKAKFRFVFCLFTAAFTFWACQANESLNLGGDETSTTDTLLLISGYPIAETNQQKCYGILTSITNPTTTEAFYGQDAQYQGNALKYSDNGDGTISDWVTGLMWQKSPDTNGDGVIDAVDKLTYDEAVAKESSFNLGGYTDWRLPTIKELYSLIVFTGIDPSGYEGTDTEGLIPFINTNYFDFGYGDLSAGERLIDAQYASSTIYTSTTMGGNATLFGVNFADGRIKGYPMDYIPGMGTKTFYVIYVRGNTGYGINQLVDNGDGTITDKATGLMWMQGDSEVGMNWEDALSYAENLEFAGYSDWRLPDAKELQSLVDYTRCPKADGTAAIDPFFMCTEIVNEANEKDFPFYWSSTTHASWQTADGANAAYVSFGRAMGYMNQWIDVHGAGAQRSDPKTGDPADYPTGHGPQGDAIRILNYVRCVRSIVN